MKEKAKMQSCVSADERFGLSEALLNSRCEKSVSLKNNNPLKCQAIFI
jgi:hypothetical protein